MSKNHYKSKPNSVKFVGWAFRGGFVLVGLLPAASRLETGIISNPASSSSRSLSESDFGLRGRRTTDVPGVLEVRRRLIEGVVRVVSGVGSSGTVPNPG